MRLVLLLQQFLGMVPAHKFGTFHQKSRCSHSGVADAVVQLGLHQLHHHADNVARGAELPVGACRGHLAQHILIHIAHGVTVVHIQLLNTLHHLHQRARLLDEEHGIVHKAAIGRSLLITDILNKGEHIEAHRVEHLLGRELPENVPAEVVVRHLPIGVGIVPVALFEHRIRVLEISHAHRLRGGFLVQLSIIQHLHKEEVGHLLKHINGVGNPAGPERHPDGIDLGFDFTSYHTVGLMQNMVQK